eukprot:gene15711-biopygen7947
MTARPREGYASRERRLRIGHLGERFEAKVPGPPKQKPSSKSKRKPAPKTKPAPKGKPAPIDPALAASKQAASKIAADKHIRLSRARMLRGQRTSPENMLPGATSPCPIVYLEAPQAQLVALLNGPRGMGHTTMKGRSTTRQSQKSKALHYPVDMPCIKDYTAPLVVEDVVLWPGDGEHVPQNKATLQVK